MTIRKFLPVVMCFLCHVSFAQNTQANLDSVSAQLITNIRLQQTEQSFILVNTKKMVDDPQGNSLNTFLVRGYHIPPEFMMPDYSNAKVRTGKFNDMRSTLYWEPSSLTDQNGQIKIPFFTSDIATNYKIVITGITSRGDVINRIISFRTE